MQWILELAATLVRRRPGIVLAIITVITVVLGGAATQIRVDVDIAQFGTGTELADAFERVTEEFGTRNASVIVLVAAGPDDSVIDRDGIELARTLVRAIEDSPAADALAPAGPLAPSITSWTLPIEQALELLDVDLDQLDDDQLLQLIAEAYRAPGAEESIGLLATDAEPATGEARAGQLLVRFDGDLDEEGREQASLNVGAAVEAVDASGYEVLPFNQALLTDELEGQLGEEMPVLLLAEVAIIALILAIAFRRFSDVLLALAGVAVTLVWLFGLVAVLGPGILGITGPFTQIGIAVPILLVGLGVDYSFHLTLRYREERAKQLGPADAAGAAIRTVGRALVLVTLTTAIGFLANVISPLPPIVDFAIFTAAGIVGALVVMSLLVPSVRHLLDRRTGAPDPPREQTGKVVAAMALAARATARHPAPVLVAIVVLAALGVVAGFNLDTEFDQEQFVPDRTRVARVIELTDELYDGAVLEQTWILVDGDATDPELANAVLVAEQRFAGVEFVDTVNGRARVTSPPGLVVRLAELVEQDDLVEVPDDVSEQLAALGWTGDGFSDDADMGGLYDLVDVVFPGRLNSVLDNDRDTMLVTIETRAGDEHVNELVDRLEAASAPIDQADGTLTVVSQELLSQQTLDDLTASQIQKIIFTVIIAGALLILYYRFARRQAMLGAITLLPTLLALPIVFGGMWLLGFGFNALTATIAAIAIGFGVDYGIHLSNRFAEEREHADSAVEAIHGTVVHTGAALVASATTTAAGFAVLAVSGIEPIRQFGVITTMTVVVAVLTTLFAETSALVLWERHRRRSGSEV